MKKALLSLSVLALLATSCKKDKDENAAITPTKENLTGSYTLAKVATKVGSSPEYEITSEYMEACDRDNMWKLNADGTYQIVDTGAKCDGDYADTWSLTNSTSIIIDGDPYTIRMFNGKSLELVEDYGGGSLITYLNKQ